MVLLLIKPHPVAVVSLKQVQGCLKRNTPVARLRSKDNYFPLTFMVPDSSPSFGMLPELRKLISMGQDTTLEARQL